MERMKRRWSVLTPGDVQMFADTAAPEDYQKVRIPSEYKPPVTDALSGQRLTLTFEEESYVYSFDGGTRLAWSRGGGQTHEELCEVLPVPGTEDVFFVHHYCGRSAPPEAHSLVLDMAHGLVTLVVAVIGVPEAAREVTRRFHFGTIDGLWDGTERHGFTAELVGKAIEWEYSKGIRIKHIYAMPLYYSYVMKMPDRCWMASNPADYVKLRDDLYIFSFLEERQAGVQGLFVIDLKTMHDVGSFFGVQASGMECYTVGAKGTYSTMETFL